MKSEKISHKLRQDIYMYRKENGLTQAEFAKKANIGSATVSHIETGNAGTMSPKTINQIQQVIHKEEPEPKNPVRERVDQMLDDMSDNQLAAVLVFANNVKLRPPKIES